MFARQVDNWIEKGLSENSSSFELSKCQAEPESISSYRIEDYDDVQKHDA